jgi:hypothetical protein
MTENAAKNLLDIAAQWGKVEEYTSTSGNGAVHTRVTFEVAERLGHFVDACVTTPTAPAVDAALPQEPPLLGRWHHGDGHLVSGTIRIAKWDCDTNPPVEFRDDVLEWVCDTLNDAINAYRATPQPAASVASGDEAYLDLLHHVIDAKATMWAAGITQADFPTMFAAFAATAPLQPLQPRTPAEPIADEFERWWEEQGQLCRSGGGDYEKTFAWRAAEHFATAASPCLPPMPNLSFHGEYRRGYAACLDDVRKANEGMAAAQPRTLDASTDEEIYEAAKSLPQPWGIGSRWSEALAFARAVLAIAAGRAATPGGVK